MCVDPVCFSGVDQGLKEDIPIVTTLERFLCACGVLDVRSYLFVIDGKVVDRLSGDQPYPIIATRLDGMIAMNSNTPQDDFAN